MWSCAHIVALLVWAEDNLSATAHVAVMAFGTEDMVLMATAQVTLQLDAAHVVALPLGGLISLLLGVAHVVAWLVVTFTFTQDLTLVGAQIEKEH